MKVLLSIFIVMLSCSIQAQYVSEYWSSASTKVDLIRKLDLNVEYSFRYINVFNYSSFGQVGLEKKLPKKIKFNLDYRFSRKIGNEFIIRKLHRPSFNFSKKFKVKKIKINVRSKFQWDFKNLYSSSKPDLIDFGWRNKVKIKKKIGKRMFLSAGYEIFTFEDDLVFSRERMFLGCSKGITKKDEISFVTMLEDQFYSAALTSVFSFSYFRKF
jgi:hypothetical protein|tara:strand:- start:2192 stop:2830 length:639 start_codon:yes stop_codon:yes gene_type:complete